MSIEHHSYPDFRWTVKEDIMIKIEEFRQSDITLLLKWLENTDSRFLCQFSGPKYNFPLDEKQLLQTIESDEYLPFKVIELERNETIGHCQFMRIDNKESKASIGRLLISPEYRGKGYGALMLEEMINYAGKELKLAKLELRVFDFNKSAVRCYRNTGFKEKKADSVFIQALNEEWKCITMDYSI